MHSLILTIWYRAPTIFTLGILKQRLHKINQPTSSPERLVASFVWLCEPTGPIHTSRRATFEAWIENENEMKLKLEKEWKKVDIETSDIILNYIKNVNYWIPI